MRSLSNNQPDCLCREETQAREKCTPKFPPGKGNCRIAHLNDEKDKVILNEHLILMTIHGKNCAFVQPIGDSRNVLQADLNRWLGQERHLSDWSHLFLLTEISNSDLDATPATMEDLEEFSIKATSRKTPKRSSKIKR